MGVVIICLSLILRKLGIEFVPACANVHSHAFNSVYKIHENLSSNSQLNMWSLKTGDLVFFFLTKQGGLWLGMTGGLSTR